MFIAASVVHWGDPFGRVEKALLFLTVFVLKRYFILNINVIEIQNIENKINDK